MSILVRNIQTGLHRSEETAFEKAAEALGVSPGQADMYVVKHSVDARHKQDIRFVYTIGVDLKEGEAAAVARANSPHVTLSQEMPLAVVTGNTKLEHPPIIAGFGPTGMFAGLLLARCGFRPIILERGQAMEQRTAALEQFWKQGVLNPSANVQFGEGGAGAFSDGKLTTRIGDPLCGFVLRELVRFGAPVEILRKAKPHVGTDYLRKVVQGIRQEILALGGEIRFDSQLEELHLGSGKLEAITVNGQQIPASSLFLAVGHSARDTFEMLLGKGLSMEQKPFSVGVRIEHLQTEVDKALYGAAAGHPALPKGEYQLSHREGDRAVYTFCMCPGGFVVPAASEQGGLVTNGMSYYSRNGENANAALVVSVDSRDFGSGLLDGVQFQRRLEQAAFAAGGGNWAAPAQTVGRFLAGQAGADFGRVTPTFACGVKPADLSAILPPQVTEMLKKGLQVFGRKQPGFAAADAVLTGVETRTSSPIRILRGQEFEAPGASGVYPCGEGAGYAGGIMSAAVDGLRAALQFASRYAPNEGGGSIML